MRKSLLNKYQVTNVPIFIKPLYYFYSYSVALILLAYALLIHITSRIQITGQENLDKTSNYIFCHWHTFIPLYFSVFLRKSSHIWMQHPFWYMKPIHLLLSITGVKKIILGSTGHSGRDAANQLVEYLKKGYSTVMLPDGPNGPPFIMKKGILHVSKQSQVPIVPIQFEVTKFFEGSTWDQKKWPYPFSTIKVQIGMPMKVTDSNFEDVINNLNKALG